MCKYLLELIAFNANDPEDYYNSNHNNKTRLSILSLNLHCTTNEVWSKAMFLHVSVIQFRGCMPLYPRGYASGYRGCLPLVWGCEHTSSWTHPLDTHTWTHPRLPPPHPAPLSTSGRYASYWNAFLDF